MVQGLRIATLEFCGNLAVGYADVRFGKLSKKTLQSPARGRKHPGKIWMLKNGVSDWPRRSQMRIADKCLELEQNLHGRSQKRLFVGGAKDSAWVEPTHNFMGGAGTDSWWVEPKQTNCGWS